MVSCGSLDHMDVAQRVRMDGGCGAGKAPWGTGEMGDKAGGSIPLGGSIPPWAQGGSSVQPSPLRGRITGMTLSDGSAGAVH